MPNLTISIAHLDLLKDVVSKIQTALGDQVTVSKIETGGQWENEIYVQISFNLKLPVA